jgi:hypothetical protein
VAARQVDPAHVFAEAEAPISTGVKSMTLDVQSILEEFNTVGTRLSAIDAALAEATNINVNSGRADLSQPFVQAAHEAVAVAGLAMDRAARILDAYVHQQSAPKPAPAPAPSLPPGQVVADVGKAANSDWRGSVDGQTLTRANWAFIANHMGAFSNKWGDVFNGPFVMGDPAQPGHTWTQGDLANTQEDSQIPGGADLAQFL